MTAAMEPFSVAKCAIGAKNDDTLRSSDGSACTRGSLRISIREARESDAERIYDIIVACLRDDRLCTCTHDERREWIALQTPKKFAQLMRIGQFLVAEDEDGWRYNDDNVGADHETKRTNVVGLSHLIPNTSSIFPEGYDLEVNLLYVDPTIVRRGIGKALMAEMEHRAVLSGCDRLCLVSTKDSLPFYEAVGFINVGDHVHRPGGSIQVGCKIMVKEGIGH